MTCDIKVLRWTVHFRWFVCNTIQPHSSQSPKKFGKKQQDFEQIKTQICGYADDILVIVRRLPALEALCVELSRETGRVGLVVSPEKTKYMKFSAFPSRRPIKGATINGVTYEGVAKFIYLGTLNWIRWSRGSVLAFSTQVCGFKPEAVGFLRAKKSSARLPSEGK